MKNLKLFLIFLMLYLSPNVKLAQSNQIPRSEYPRPQFQRSQWINLNGAWSYCFDFGKSGRDRGLEKSPGFDKSIIVPFCPESKLSGVGYKDFINALWYQRSIEVPGNWGGDKILLHFGAADYKCEVFIDGKSVGKHWGGSSSFGFDITKFASPGIKHNLVVYIEDDTRSRLQPAGKQTPSYYSEGCMYTRTTGIWQTVWLEAVSPYGLESCNIVANLDQKQFILKPEFYSLKEGMKLRITMSGGDKKAKSMEVKAGSQTIVLPVDNLRTWSPEDPFLYDFVFEVFDGSGKILDKVSSYAGMRKIHIEGNKIFLNNSPVFLRLVLDQGYYPDGVLTAPSDEALKGDIELSIKAGFNGARLHQKVFEERFHYWADKLGYLTWGEFPSWGFNMNDLAADRNYINEWTEVVQRDRNHPSIIAWSPFNETYWGAVNQERDNWSLIRENHDRLLVDVYNLTKLLDPSRPINETSGFIHVKTDLWTVHNYDQDPADLKKWLNPKDGMLTRNYPDLEAAYTGQPYLVDEYGGIKWISSDERRFSDKSWGYGNGPKNLEEYYKRLEDLTNVLLETDFVSGYCYTQLYDIEQEQNGIYNFDRTEKFDMKRIHNILSKKPVKLSEQGSKNEN